MPSRSKASTCFAGCIPIRRFDQVDYSLSGPFTPLPKCTDYGSLSMSFLDVGLIENMLSFFRFRLKTATMSSCLTEDPDKLLNEWLGELENLIGVSSRVQPDFVPVRGGSFGIFCRLSVRQFSLIMLIKSRTLGLVLIDGCLKTIPFRNLITSPRGRVMNRHLMISFRSVR